MPSGSVIHGNGSVVPMRGGDNAVVWLCDPGTPFSYKGYFQSDSRKKTVQWLNEGRWSRESETDYDLKIVFFRGDNRKMFVSTEPEVAIVGGADCIAGETIIEGTGKTIKWLCDNCISPIVQTLLGPRRAGVPFLKGRDRLYEVTTTDGRRFKATAKHLVLTDSGYVFLSSLRPGSKLRSYEPSHLESNFDTSLSIHASNVRNSPKTNSRFSGSLFDLLKAMRGLLSPIEELISCFLDKETSCAFDCLKSIPALKDSASPDRTLRQWRQPPFDSAAFRKTISIFETFAQPLSAYSQSCQYHTTKLVIVSSVCAAEYADFYDLTVPDAGHYFASGLIHHNTGKSFASCLKIDTLCKFIPKTQVLLCRKLYSSLVGSIVQTYLSIVAGSDVEVFGGRTPSRFIYKNGSVVWLGGLDSPEAFLSAWFDTILVNQAEQITLEEFEMLGCRCTGRNAVVKYPQMLLDLNPSSRKHWILERAAQGKLRLLNAFHKDNPSLYDPFGEITDDGKNRIGRLSTNLSGIRRERLFEGKWATAEGVIFDTFNPEVHVIERDDNEFVTWYLCQDEGYTNPATILLVGSDSDGRWHIAREYYERGVAEIDVVKVAAEWNKEKKCELDAVDEAGAGLIAACINAGINAIGGKGRLLDGIMAIQNRLKVNEGDVSEKFPKGRPRLTISKSCPQTINEFESYVWKPGKDIPVDADNHSVSSIRYLHDVLFEGTGSFSNTSTIAIPKAPPTQRFVSARPRFVPRRY